MNQWEKAFNENKIHQILSDALSVAESIEFKTPDPAIAEQYRRILHVLKHTKRLLGLADPNLVLVAQLDQLFPFVQNMKSGLDNFKANPAPSYLAQANSYADQLLQKINVIPLLSLPRSVGAIKETMESFSRVSSDLLSSLKASSEEMQSRVREITAQMAEHRQAIEKHDSTIDSQKARIDNVIAEFQSQFSAAEEKRRQDHAELIRHTQDDYATFKKDVEEGQETFFHEQQQEQLQRIDKLEAQASATLAKLGDLQKQAANIVQIISNIGVTGNYSKYAGADRKTANILRVLAVLFMIGLIAGAVSTIWLAIEDGKVDWHIMGFRIFVTLTFAVPAFYLAYESEKHRSAERRYRTKELELASIDPYLEKLPDETRREIKARLTERFFGTTLTDPTAKDENVSAKNIWEFLKDIVETALKK